MIGRRLGHYTILERIGRGGMGEVYLAQDERLGRRVALKILPAEMAADPERLHRFEREARAVAALNHPNIVTIHSVEEMEGLHFITMELVEGQTLTELIPREGFQVDRFFDIAIPLSDAINAAHKQGITHRDLKPDNIKVTPGGQVKVLDFGLAKLSDPVGDANSATIMQETQDGRILGTVHYMSPEQAQGKAIDHRSDIFSLGIVLYEMATGVRPFQGDTSISVLSSILKDTPTGVTEVKHSLPLHLGRIIGRCLVKDPDGRYHSAQVLREELESLRKDMATGILEVSALQSALALPRPAAPGRRRLPWKGLAAGVAVLALALAVWRFLPRGQGDDDEKAPPKESSVAVMDFRHEGEATDAGPSSMLAGLIQVGLIENSPCRVITREFLKDVRRRLFGSPQGPIDENQILELGRAGGASSLIIGTINPQPDGYMILWQLVDAADGRALEGGRVTGSDYLALADGVVAGALGQLELACGEQSKGEAASVAELTTKSPEAYRHFDDGLRALDESRLVDAETYFLKATVIDSSFALAFTRLADVYTAQYKMPQAKECAEKAWGLRTNLGVRDRLKLEATRARLDMKETEWLATNEEILKRWPDDRDALQAIIGNEYQTGFLEEAAERSARASQLYPDDRSINTLYAYILAGLSRPDEALKVAQAHVQQRPDNPNGWDTLGDIFLKRGEPDRAREAFQKAVDLAPDFWASHRNLARCDYMAGNLDGAIGRLEGLIARADDPDRMLRILGIWLAGFYRAAGRFDDAERILKSRMPKDPGFYAQVDGQIGLVYHYLAGGEAAKALALLSEARPRIHELEALAPTWSALRITALIQADSLPAARAQLAELEGRADKKGPYSAPRAAALDSEAQIDQATGESEKALERIQELRRIIGNDFSEPRINELAVEAYRRLGRPKDAADLIRRAMPYAAGWARYHYLLGELDEEMGHAAEAAGEYERFLAMWRKADGDRPELADARARLARLGGGTS